MDSQPDNRASVRTRRSLISRLRNLEDRESWQDFFDTYWRLIYSVARKAGLTEEEAEEVVQDTTVAVSKYIREYRYDPNVCSFKNWLLHKTRWKIIDQTRKRTPAFVERLATQTATAQTSTLENVADPRGLPMDEVWELEWKKNLVTAAMGRVKSRIKAEHYQIFYLSAVRMFGPRKVSQMMGVNVAKVYLVRHRVAGLVKKEVQVLEKLEP